MVYLLFVLAIGLAAVVALQFAYLAFLEMTNRQLKSEIHQQEQLLANLRGVVRQLRSVPETDPAQTDNTKPLPQTPGETWPEYLDTER